MNKMPELKTGYLVTCKNGEVHVVIKNTFDGRNAMYDINNGKYIELHTVDSDGRSCFSRNHDVVKVEKFDSTSDMVRYICNKKHHKLSCIWEEMSEEEEELLDIIDSLQSQLEEAKRKLEEL